MEELLKKANQILEIQGLDGNWNADEYMRGMYNGMELIISILEQEREPVFKSIPLNGYKGDSYENMFTTTTKIENRKD